MRVVGTIDGVTIRSSLLPRGGGALFVVVGQPIRERIGKAAGARVELSLEVDRRPPALVVPADLRKALGTEKARFDGLAPSHRKAFLLWIGSAKRPETRQRRLRSTVEMVHRGATLD